MISLLSLQRLTVTLILLCVSASGRHILEEFDLEAAAAEPRPTVIETGPSAEALPLVYSEDTTPGPLSVASEKVEKFLRPAYSFAYNKKDDVDVAESKVDENQSSEASSDYQHEKEKNVAVKGETEDVVVAEKGETEDVVVADKGETEDAAIESEAAESKHHEHKDHGGDHAVKFEKAGGKDTHSHHHGEHGEKGDKGYKGHHHHDKGQKGHHDKEHHSKHYDEHGGDKKDHHHEDGYHGEYHKSHGGKKGGKYKEDGEHSKGHSTKGEHNIHKKEEYDKKTEFFEEENEGGESETHGGFKHESEYAKGGHHKGGHKKGGHHEDHYGKKGESEKGGHYKDEKGHNEKGGHEKHHKHESKHGEKEGHATGKKWAYKKGDGDGGGGGGGHGHGGAHSHHTYAVQEPPRQEEPAETVPITKITPISTFVLPLEGESINNEDIKEKSDDDIEEDENRQIVVAKEHRLEGFKPSPLENNNSDDDLALISLPSDSQVVTQPPQEAFTTLSTVERYIRQEMQKLRPIPEESNVKVTAIIENDNSDDDLPIISDVKEVTQPPQVELKPTTTGSRYVRQDIQQDRQNEHSTPKPEETRKVTRKRRLKKRRISKVSEANLQKREILLVPEESSKSFVIVAAEDV